MMYEISDQGLASIAGALALAVMHDIDFWVNQKTGKLEVDNVKMHKVPVQEDGVWTQVPRYTFDGMDFDVTN